MNEIGLFPLGIVLLPTERLPLHVFEPRYKELVDECIAEEREFGLILADDDGLREVGTRARVVEVLETFDDGRMVVIVEGRDRFRLVELTTGRTFQTGEVEPLADVESGADPVEIERSLVLLRRVGELAGADVAELDVATEIPSFELAARVELEPGLKQSLLESRSEPERLRRFSTLLTALARRLEAQAERRRIAAANGHLRRS
ncbi:MAG: LON peptidase substrate-binding domain-containing protein [Actinomycetota bacterium]|nr:LON peptidase substrate-binding domain-containing protein [Actinomycetota bacterium]